jgi:AraC-like DNA-binding protein
MQGREVRRPRVSVGNYQSDPLFPRIARVVSGLLQHDNVVTPVSVLIGMSLLTPARAEDWRHGRVPYLEQVINCNLTRLSLLLRILRFHAHELNLKPSWTAYMRWGKGPSAPGRGIALSRLMDLLFVEAIRYWLVTTDEQRRGSVGALRDPRIGAPLVRMHEQPGRAWDVEALAAEVAMSRSSFAQRFVELVGEPPSKYLTRWRMQRAAHLLLAAGKTIAQTAAQVGYDSEAAFSRVFKRYMHVSPAAFRKEKTGGAPGPCEETQERLTERKSSGAQNI